MSEAMMTLAEAARALAARLIGVDRPFTGVSTDSRTLAVGELFVALRGPRFDGHDFVAEAAARGAAGAIVERPVTGLACIVVPETLAALGRLAAHWRARHRLPLVAVCGSNGKTTTKEMIAAILRTHAGPRHVLATAGNLNNEVGLPLTLLALRARHRLAVVELGMNRRGELARLAAIARPTVGLVTNAQRDHLEFLGSAEIAAVENAAVYDALPADGTAVWNADDPHAELFRARAAGRPALPFALETEAPVRAEFRPVAAFGMALRLRTPAGELRARLAAAGRHNAANAAAAAACALAAGVPRAAIGEGLARFRPAPGRLRPVAVAAGALIDDSYNANPDSVRAAIDVLADAGGETVLVLGDMGETGEAGPDLHLEAGRYAAARGVCALLALGELTAHAVAGFGRGARHYSSADELVAAVRERLAAGATVLVKGSRFMRMETVVAALAGAPVEVH